jgi:hypothetical protein
MPQILHFQFFFVYFRYEIWFWVHNFYNIFNYILYIYNIVSSEFHHFLCVWNTCLRFLPHLNHDLEDVLTLRYMSWTALIKIKRLSVITFLSLRTFWYNKHKVLDTHAAGCIYQILIRSVSFLMPKLEVILIWYLRRINIPSHEREELLQCFRYWNPYSGLEIY